MKQHLPMICGLALAISLLTGCTKPNIPDQDTENGILPTAIPQVTNRSQDSGDNLTDQLERRSWELQRDVEDGMDRARDATEDAKDRLTR